MKALNQAGETPRINIKLETHDGGYSICSTYIPVIRVEQEDDGSFTAVSNYWPETNSATVEAATIDEWCERIWPMFNAEFTDDNERKAMRERLMQAAQALASQPAQPECNRPNEGCAYPVCGDDCRHRAQPAQPQAGEGQQ